MDRYIDIQIGLGQVGDHLQLVISFYLCTGLRKKEKSFQTGKVLKSMFKGH